MNKNIVLKSISYVSPTGDKILKDISLTLTKQRNGLIGPNGSGKTTLLRLIGGEIRPASGEIIKNDGLIVWHLPQDYRVNPVISVNEALGVDVDGIGNAVNNALIQMGLDQISLSRHMGTLSGGERMRVLLAAAFLKNPDFLLLDEPTNNLDAGARQFVYDAVGRWRGGLVVVSHDRRLLSLVDSIIELTPDGVKVHTGDYQSYLQQKAEEKQAAVRHLKDAGKTLKRTLKIFQKKKESQDRRMGQGKKSRKSVGMNKGALNFFAERAERTAGRQKNIFSDRIDRAQTEFDRAQKKIRPENKIVVDLSGSKVPAGKAVASLKNVTFGYSDSAPLFRNLNLEIYGPERIAVSGPNGSGKTTLIKLLTNQLQPLAGEARLRVRRWAYLDQRADSLPGGKTLVESIEEKFGGDETQARNWLARFMFKGDSARKRPEEMSGGERMRGALAYILAGDNLPQLLVLDEPTNNLDINTTEQVTSALKNFEGAIIVISHDQEFLEGIGVTRTIGVDNL